MQKEQDNAPVGALLKGFGVIEQLSTGKSPLVDIARRMGLPKSSVYRFLSTLVELGVVTKADNDEYSLTAKLFQYGVKAVNALELVPTALPAMRRLRDTVGETVHLAVRSGEHAVYLHKVESPHSLRMYSRPGYQAPLYCTSLGKCLLAWLHDEQLLPILDRMVFVPAMPNTIQDKTTFLSHLRVVREQGYAVDDEENEANVICFGAPIFDHYNQISAAVSVSMPLFRFLPERREMVVEAVQQAGRDVSGCFGRV